MIRRFLGFRVLLIKLVGLVLVVGGGMSSGSEGPLIHIACCWGMSYHTVASMYLVHILYHFVPAIPPSFLTLDTHHVRSTRDS